MTYLLSGPNHLEEILEASTFTKLGPSKLVQTEDTWEVSITEIAEEIELKSRSLAQFSIS